ncbi:hypothetical protein [Herbaspirillum chlorophenolicum]|uniref:hypothetical protein n=1 Tax=Herbaspirillum chlorophenolicum TaxID=211589 RepID=UPI00067C706C|nr:hypothetical protein [Herbaspirillum chlorophenolicum]
MDKTDHGATTIADANRFVFCSSNGTHARWLAQALNEWQVQQQELVALPLLAAQIGESRPRLVFLDFSGNCGSSIANCAADMIALAQTLKKEMPHCLLIAVGTMNYPEGAVAALRAGVNHFIDMSAAAVEARDVVRKLIASGATSSAQDSQQGVLIALLGARAGIGTTTMAVHLADLLQQRHIAGQAEFRVALLDLGLPAGDGQLYLNASGSFHFADVVRSRHRLDQTLIQTALTRSRSGIKIISIPRSAHQISGLAAADIVAVLALLRSYFDVLVMDLGGFADPALACKMAATADQTWLLTDQSAGSLVSLAALIAELDLHASVTATPPRQLIVNRYNKQYGMSAEQIAERFQLNLAAAIPDRTASLMSSANQGKLLHEIVGSDSYLHALETLVEKTLGSVVKINGAGTLSRWLSGVLFR